MIDPKLFEKLTSLEGSAPNSLLGADGEERYVRALSKAASNHPAERQYALGLISMAQMEAIIGEDLEAGYAY